MDKERMEYIACPLCGGEREYITLYEQNFRTEELPELLSFDSTQPVPHYRIVKCSLCGVTYSNPILPPETVCALYKKASRLVSQNYEIETDNVNLAYIRYLDRALEIVPVRGRLLDIGCGSGFFLQRALDRGFKEVYGVEPSEAAYEKTSAHLKNNIRHDVFRQTDYTDKSFDLISCFHVLDHVVDPGAFIRGVKNCLEDGGIVLAITHNVSSLLSSVMGERWDPFNTAHITFFNKATLAEIFEKNGFRVRSIFDMANTFSLGHWILRSPLPGPVKAVVHALCRGVRLDKARLTMRIGNIGIIAQRPSE